MLEIGSDHTHLAGTYHSVHCDENIFYFSFPEGKVILTKELIKSYQLRWIATNPSTEENQEAVH